MRPVQAAAYSFRKRLMQTVLELMSVSSNSVMGITVRTAAKYVISHACGDAPHFVASAQALEFETGCSPSQNGEIHAFSAKWQMKWV
jgi:hypothetical protein